MIDLPESIRVGYQTYKIVRMSPMRATATDVYGECDNAQLEIRVRADLSPVKMANATLHEILHACYYIGCVDDTDEQERVVSILANQMTQVMRDNPTLVAWLVEQLTPPA